jgi:hypothetical protein
MTDEYLMRYWADAHNEFSSNLDRGLVRLMRFLRPGLLDRRTIRRAYRSAGDEMSETARAALAGVLACLATCGVLLTLSLLFAADIPAHAAAGAPIIAHAIIA